VTPSRWLGAERYFFLKVRTPGMPVDSGESTELPYGIGTSTRSTGGSDLGEVGGLASLLRVVP
jgi:hypothetical protein